MSEKSTDKSPFFVVKLYQNNGLTPNKMFKFPYNNLGTLINQFMKVPNKQPRSNFRGVFRIELYFMLSIILKNVHQ